MKTQTEVARYAAKMARELGRMCREEALGDLAHLFEVAAAEAEAAAQERVPIDA
jgi:hypothetical protein